MKAVFYILLLFFLPQQSLFAESGQKIDIDIEGMSCKFCALKIRKNLDKIPEIEHADINADTGKAHIVMRKGNIGDIEELRRKVIDAGFTPVKVTTSN